MTEDERRRQYNQFIAVDIPGMELSLIRQALQRGQLTGTTESWGRGEYYLT